MPIVLNGSPYNRGRYQRIYRPIWIVLSKIGDNNFKAKEQDFKNPMRQVGIWHFLKGGTLRWGMISKTPWDTMKLYEKVGCEK